MLKACKNAENKAMFTKWSVWFAETKGRTINTRTWKYSSYRRWQRRKLKRIVKPVAKPRFHETTVSDITQFYCVKRKFYKLLGFGIAVSLNWILAAWNWIWCGRFHNETFIYRSRFHQESHLQLNPNYTISLAIHVTSDGDITMLSLKM